MGNFVPTQLTLNTVALNRGLFIPPEVQSADAGDSRLAASLQAELMNLGYVLDDSAFAAASRAHRDWLIAYHNEVIPHLRARLGAGRPCTPFYRNFPDQVMAMDELELFLNAIVHYWSNGRWEPPQELQTRGFAFENVEFKSHRLGTEADLRRGFTKMVSINQSLTQQDKAALVWLIQTYGKTLELPAVVPFKETLCILAANGLDVAIKTPTDVLRVAVFLSGGDISLPQVPKPFRQKDLKPGVHTWYLEAMRTSRAAAREKFKFMKFPRPVRRQLLALLEATNLDTTEMQRHLGRWLRLGEILHVGEHANQFPRTAEAFARLRNQHKETKIRTFAARVDMAFARNWREGAELLATRPGEFARRLDWMLRNYDPEPVLAIFVRVAGAISSKLLIELYNHFRQRYQVDAPRSVMLKGARSKMKTLPALPPMNADLVQRIGNVLLAVMRDRIARLPPLGNVWIDDRLRHVPVPFAMRSVNTAVRTYVRGTRVPFRPDAKVIRPFIHWYDEHGSEDLDLSVGLYDAALRQVGHVSFTGLKDLGCCHSGDIRHRRGACAEYVDIPVEAATTRGVRYATVHAYNYDGRPMHTVKDCVFGLMEREHAQANEIFVPRTISNCMGLANEGTSVVGCIIDLVEHHYIWADVESGHALATLENTAGSTGEVLRALLHNTKMSVHELLSLHARARGSLVPAEGDADVKWRWEDFVTDYAAAGTYMNF
jgi:hypothetical protein